MSTNTNARGLRRGRRLGLAALALAGVTAGLAVATSGTASALPLCGGNQNVQMAPVTCTNSRTIDGTTFTVVLDVTAGGTITASYTLDAPRSVDTPDPGALTPGDLVHPAGPRVVGRDPGGRRRPPRCRRRSTAARSTSKAVFTGNGDARGRIAAPFVTTANDCQSAPTTTAPPTTTPTTTSDDAGDHRAADRPDHDAIVGEPDLGGRVDDGRVQQLGRPADDGHRHRPARRERPARPGRHRADHQEPRRRRHPAVTLPGGEGRKGRPD